MPPVTAASHVRQMFASGGVLGFWTGASATVPRAVILDATKLATYDESKCQLRKHLGLSGVPLQATAAASAGFAYVCTTAPIDFARTRYMTARQLSAATGQACQYKGALDVMAQTVRTEGPMALYRGFLPQWARAAPYTVVQTFAWEQLCAIFGTTAV